MEWTEARVDQLKRLWDEGLSASQIASRLGDVTRNAVIGKAHRLGLSSRPSPIKRVNHPITAPHERMCQWPIGNPRDPSFRFCGKPAAPDRPHAAPVLVTGGQIITMNAAMPAAEAMLVEDGRIAWVGQLSDVPDAAEGVERLDLNGKVVVPGFVEPHMHLPPLAMMHAFSNIGPNRFDTTAQALAQLAS